MTSFSIPTRFDCGLYLPILTAPKYPLPMESSCRPPALRWTLAAALCTFITLGCRAPGQPIDPASATAQDVEGWWLHRGPDPYREATVFGFLGQAIARRQLPLDENQVVLPAGAGVSTVYAGTAWGGPLIAMQVGTYAVSGGKLLEEVLADRDGPSDAAYATAIRALTPGVSMTLESSRDPSGARAYSWHDRCPVVGATGWYVYAPPVPGCAPSMASGNSLAVDADGDLHATVGVFTGSGCVKASYAYITRGCEPRRYVLPTFGYSALEVRDGKVRIALVTADSNQLVLFEGKVGALSFTQSLIDPAPGTTRGLRFLQGAARPTLLWKGGTDTAVDTLLAYTQEADGRWTQRAGAEVPVPWVSAVTPAGDVAFIREGAVHRVQLDGTPAGAPLPLPEPRESSVAPRVLADGRVQVVYAERPIGTNFGGVGGVVMGWEGIFAEWNGQAWTRTRLGLMQDAYVASPPSGGPARIVASLEKAAYPTYALYEVSGGQVTHSERIFANGTVGAGATQDYHTEPQAVVDAQGAIAFSTTGLDVVWRPVTGATDRAPASVDILFDGSGKARLVSDDGRVNCSGPCTVTGRSGERLRVRAVPEKGSRARMTCHDSTVFGRESCDLDLTGTRTTFIVSAALSPFERAMVVGNPGGSAKASRASVLGERLVLLAEVSPGQASFQVGSTPVPLAPATTRAVVGFNRATASGWSTALPEPALAVRALEDGGAWVVLPVNGVADIGGRGVGAAGETHLVRLRLGPDGKTLDAVTLASGSVLNGMAGDVAPDGTAAVAFRAGSAPAEFARVGPTGGAVRIPRGAEGPASHLALHGERAVVAVGTSLVSLTGPVVTATRPLPGARVESLALDGPRALLALTLLAEADVGGGPRPAGGYLVQYDASLALTAAVKTPAVAVVAVPGGAIAATASAATRYDLSLAPVGTSLNLGLANHRIVASAPGDDSLAFVSAIQGAAIIDGFNMLEGVPRTALLEVRP
jgi:hypothetical protein